VQNAADKSSGDAFWAFTIFEGDAHTCGWLLFEYMQWCYEDGGYSERQQVRVHLCIIFGGQKERADSNGVQRFWCFFSRVDNRGVHENTKARPCTLCLSERAQGVSDHVVQRKCKFAWRGLRHKYISSRIGSGRFDIKSYYLCALTHQAAEFDTTGTDIEDEAEVVNEGCRILRQRRQI
jgi:hypothetical protein